jgi:hypothetical protein
MDLHLSLSKNAVVCSKAGPEVTNRYPLVHIHIVAMNILCLESHKFCD